MKHLLNYNNQSEYNSVKNRLLTNLGGGWTAHTLEDDLVNYYKYSPTYGDFYLYDKENNTNIIVNQKEFSSEKYLEDKFTPIGVVVIPKSHNVYGDGSCGVMSICEMSCDTQQEDGGTESMGMYWGANYTDIGSLPNLERVPIVSDRSNVYNEVQSQGQVGYLPSTKFNQLKNPYDISYYYHTDYYRFIPSSYLADGSRNPSYYQTSAPSSTANALADFDGRGNTDKILEVRGVKDYTTWKPTYNTEADYPAASCCDMFSTVGTEQGDWYLPSCGEFGYVMVRLKEINETLDKLKVAYPNTPIVSLGTNNDYWSSSENSSSYVYHIGITGGSVSYAVKGSYNYVRAFLRVKV